MQGKYGEAIKAFTDAIQQLPAGESGGYAAKPISSGVSAGTCRAKIGWPGATSNKLPRSTIPTRCHNCGLASPLPTEGDFRSAIDSFGEAISKNPSFSVAVHQSRFVLHPAR